MSQPNALTVKQYLHNKGKRTNALYISGDVKRWFIDGVEFTDEQLNETYPVHLRILNHEDIRLLKGFNQDKTKIAL